MKQVDTRRKLLGFDIRQYPGSYVLTDWSPESFLLKHDVRTLLSVDTDIWPSVFDNLDETEFPKNSLRPSVWVWLNLKVMIAFSKKQKKAQNTRGVQIAVELIIDRSVAEDEFWEGVLGPYGSVSPDKIPSSWVPLGYDVADRYQVSGLCNCRYEPREKGRLEPVWRPRLNEFGLLRTLGDARRFKDITDKRVRNHAPFYVYGLYSNQ